MNKVVLILVLTGYCMLADASEQYFFIPRAANFVNAQNYCRSLFTDLATVNNSVGMKSLLASVPDGYAGSAWIGLYRVRSAQWHWSLAMDHFYGKGQSEYRNWQPGEPNNAGGIEDCVVMSELGQFLDIPCTGYPKRFACYDDKSYDKYLIVNYTKVWRDAQSYCREKHTDLVSIRNPEENRQVQKFVKAGEKIFIGLFKDYFWWSDSRDSSFRYWKTNQPDNVNKNENCVGADLSAGGQWMDQNCENTQPFVCYTDVRQKQILKLEVRSVQDVNSPEMTTEILKKIEQQLKDQGLENITLSWRTQRDGNIFQKTQISTVTSCVPQAE